MQALRYASTRAARRVPLRSSRAHRSTSLGNGPAGLWEMAAQARQTCPFTSTPPTGCTTTRGVAQPSRCALDSVESAAGTGPRVASRSAASVSVNVTISGT